MMFFKKIFSITFSFLFIVSNMNLRAFADEPSKAFVPDDRVSIVKVSDGTHDKPENETFINSKNGYKVADDNEKDGVVSSGDYVKYNINLQFAPGMKRVRYMTISQTGDSLDLSDVSSLSLDSSVIVSTYAKNRWKFEIPRGAVGRINATLSVKAKDTKGKIVTGNRLKVLLSDDSSFNYESISDAVTVVSVPFADLTIDTDLLGKSDNVRQYNQNTNEGSFNIVPTTLRAEGYSMNGLVSSTLWHTDINVSKFPKNTRWWINDTEVKPVDGIIKNVKGEGTSILKYRLSDDDIPKENTPLKAYSIWLIPYEDSFKAGDSYNIKDIGINEKDSYNTAEYKLNGHYVGAKRGFLNLNNNYGTAYWQYVRGKKVATSGYKFDFYSSLNLPRNNHKSIFEKENMYFDNNIDFYRQGSSENTGFMNNYVTSNTDMYSKVHVTFNGPFTYHKDNIQLGATFNDISGDSYRDFDIVKEPVVVLYNNKKLSPDNYTVKWRYSPTESLKDDVVGASKWIESNQVPNNKVNQMKVNFKKGLLKNNYESNIGVYTRLKMKSNYDTLKDNGKMIHFTGSILLDDAENDIGESRILIFPAKPKLTASINNYDVTFDKKLKSYRASFEIADFMSSVLSTKGLSYKRVLTFDPIYDIDSFKILYDGFEFEKTGEHEITIQKKNHSLYSRRSNNFYLDDMRFSINTLYGLKDASITGNVSEKVYVTYPDFGTIKSDTLVSTDSAFAAFQGLLQNFSVLESLNRLGEVDSKIGFNVKLNTVDKGFSQNVYLPFNGDSKEFIPMLNKSNNTNIQINEVTGFDSSNTMDGVGRSKFSGSYKLDSIELSNYPSDLKVMLNYEGKEYPLSVKDGRVDVSSVSSLKFDNKKAYLTFTAKEGISKYQISGIGAKINLLPNENKKDDEYVMWMSKTEDFNKKPVSDKIAWPDYVRVVSSSISGYVWHDDDRNYEKNDEDGFKNVSLSLQKYVSDKWVDTGKTTVTDGHGFYKFDDLKHDKYRVLLSKVKTEDAKIISIDGDKNGNDGDLVVGKTNRFGVFENTVQSYSYLKYNKNSKPYTDIDLPINKNFTDVNFGFYIPDKDLVLDVRHPEITNNDSLDKTTAKWFVTVRNTGNTDIDGLSMTNRLSKNLENVHLKLNGYSFKKGVSEPIKKVFGTDMKTADDIMFTTDKAVYMLHSNGEVIELKGVSSDILYNAGSFDPLPLGFFSDGPKHQNKVFLSDGQKLYIVSHNGDIKTVESLGNISYMYKSPDDDFGFVMSDTGFYKVDNNGLYESLSTDSFTINNVDEYYGTYSFATDKGLYVYKKGSFGKKIESKEPILYHNGYYYASSKRLWYDNGYKSFDVIGFDGEIKDIFGKDDDLLLFTTNGVWTIKYNVVHKQYDIEGNFIKAVGTYLGSKGESSAGGMFASKSGFIMATTTGFYVYDNDEQDFKKLDITGFYKDLYGGDPLSRWGPGAIIVTTDGVWKMMDDLVKYTGIEGQLIDSVGKQPFLSEPIVYTTKGIYALGNEDKAKKTNIDSTVYTKEVKETVDSHDIVNYSVSEKPYYNDISHKLPKLHPNNEFVIEITGDVLPVDKSSFVYNQTFVTSDTTPRSGITTSKVTGQNMPAGVPDAPDSDDSLLMSSDISVPTSTINSSIISEIGHDDLSDQTGFVKNATDSMSIGSLSGYAFKDLNRNGLRDDNASVSGIKVSIFTENGEFVKSTVTDKNGYWKVSNLKVGKYRVHYDILGYTSDNKIWTSAEYHKGDNSKLDSDVDTNGYVVELVDTVGVSDSMSNADCGIVSVDSSIQLQKGPQLDIIRGNERLTDDVSYEDDSDIESTDVSTRLSNSDNDLKTSSYLFSVRNNGNSALTDIRLKDALKSGNDAKIGLKFALFDSSNKKVSSDIVLKGDVFYQGDTPLVLQKGYLLVGQLHVAFSLKNDVHEDEMTVDASVLNNNGERIGKVSDKDSLKAVYKYVPDRKLTVSKLGGNVANHVSLSDVSFRIDRLTDEKTGTYKSVGTYVTDENGKFEVKLSEGHYRIFELETKFGYMLPKGDGWFVDLTDKDGTTSVKIKADSNMPYSEVTDSNDGWGEIDLYNYKLVSVPFTGGNMLILAVCGSLCVGIGLILLYYKRKTA